MVLFSGNSKLGCFTVQVKLCPANRLDRKRTKLRVDTKPSSWTWVSATEPMLLLFSACQLRAAAEATLTAEQRTVVNLRPLFHSWLTLMLTLGRAVWKTEVEQEPRHFFSVRDIKIHNAGTRPSTSCVEINLLTDL